MEALGSSGPGALYQQAFVNKSTMSLSERRIRAHTWCCGDARGPEETIGARPLRPRTDSVRRRLESGPDEHVAAELLGQQHLNAVDAFLDGEELLQTVETLVHVVIDPGDDVGDSKRQLVEALIETVEALVEVIAQTFEGEWFRHRVKVKSK